MTTPSTDLIGTWLLQSFDKEQADDSWQPWPRGAHGMLLYTAAGYMSASINWPPDADGRFCDAYAGTWSVHGNEVRHHVTNSVRPKRIGKTLERRFSLDGDTLIIHLTNSDGHLRVCWQRAPV